MNTDITITVSFLIAAVGFSITIFNWYVGRKKDTIADQEEKSKMKEDFIKVNLKLDNICQNLSELRQDTKSIAKDVKEMDKRITILENDQRTIWNAIDEIRGTNK